MLDLIFLIEFIALELNYLQLINTFGRVIVSTPLWVQFLSEFTYCKPEPTVPARCRRRWDRGSAARGRIAAQQ